MTAPLPDLEFWMLDGEKLLRCVITRAALSDITGKDVGGDLIGVFNKHRDYIATVANQLFESGKLVNGTVRIVNGNVELQEPS